MKNVIRKSDNFAEQFIVSVLAQFLDAFFQIKYTEAIISNGTRKLLWFEITKIIVSYIIIFAHFRFP